MKKIQNCSKILPAFLIYHIAKKRLSQEERYKERMEKSQAGKSYPWSKLSRCKYCGNKHPYMHGFAHTSPWNEVVVEGAEYRAVCHRCFRHTQKATYREVVKEWNHRMDIDYQQIVDIWNDKQYLDCQRIIESWNAHRENAWWDIEYDDEYKRKLADNMVRIKNILDHLESEGMNYFPNYYQESIDFWNERLKTDLQPMIDEKLKAIDPAYKKLSI